MRLPEVRTALQPLRDKCSLGCVVAAFRQGVARDDGEISRVKPKLRADRSSLGGVVVVRDDPHATHPNRENRDCVREQRKTHSENREKRERAEMTLLLPRAISFLSFSDELSTERENRDVVL